MPDPDDVLTNIEDNGEHWLGFTPAVWRSIRRALLGERYRTPAQDHALAEIDNLLKGHHDENKTT